MNDKIEKENINQRKLQDIYNDAIKDINEDILDELDFYINRYISNLIDDKSKNLIEDLINDKIEVKNRYREFKKLTDLVNETLVAKATEPMPESTKKILSKYKSKKRFKIFSIAGLSTLAAAGWLGTLSLGTIQYLGIMSATTIPTAVMRGVNIEEQSEIKVLEIEDNCVTFTFNEYVSAISTATKQTEIVCKN